MTLSIEMVVVISFHAFACGLHGILFAGCSVMNGFAGDNEHARTAYKV